MVIHKAIVQNKSIIDITDLSSNGPKTKPWGAPDVVF